MRTFIFICALMGASCGKDIDVDACNGVPVDVEVANRGQFTIDTLEIGDQSVLAAPLNVDETLLVTAFERAESVSFVRQRPDQRDALRVSASEAICVTPSSRLVLFDQSFRVEDISE